MKKSGVKS